MITKVDKKHDVPKPNVLVIQDLESMMKAFTSRKKDYVPKISMRNVSSTPRLSDYEKMLHALIYDIAELD